MLSFRQENTVRWGAVSRRWKNSCFNAPYSSKISSLGASAAFVRTISPNFSFSFKPKLSFKPKVSFSSSRFWNPSFLEIPIFVFSLVSTRYFPLKFRLVVTFGGFDLLLSCTTCTTSSSPCTSLGLLIFLTNRGCFISSKG